MKRKEHVEVEKLPAALNSPHLHINLPSLHGNVLLFTGETRQSLFAPAVVMGKRQINDEVNRQETWEVDLNQPSESAIGTPNQPCKVCLCICLYIFLESKILFTDKWHPRWERKVGM